MVPDLSEESEREKSEELVGKAERLFKFGRSWRGLYC